MPLSARSADERAFSAEGTGSSLGSLRRMASETFKWNWRGWARSSEGYAVRLMGRTKLQYSDEFGDVHIAAEAMTKPSTEVVVFTTTIPDRSERPRDGVLSRLRRAFPYKGWSMVEEDG
jgi:hypothetical protein